MAENVSAAMTIDNDLGIVISALRLLEEATGETFDDEGGTVAQIERDHAKRVAIRNARLNFVNGS